jgi:thiamine-monophosphate kinase
MSGPDGRAAPPIGLGVLGPGSLGPGVEFDRIRGFLAGLTLPPHVRVGPGDDGAVLDSGVVLSTDLSVEGVHFRLDWLTPEEVGWRATAAAVSDLAAMGARPLGVLVSLGVPAPGTLADPIMAGVRALCDAMEAPLLGGDLTRSPGPVIVDVSVVGTAPIPLLRSGARPGDAVFVTGGNHGAPDAALSRWIAGESPTPEARVAFARPRPRTREALWLMARGIPTAGLDLSDGIASDAAHLAAASACAVELDGEALLRVSHREDPEESPERVLRRALVGGEAYELLFTAPPLENGGWVEEFAASFDLSVTRVGSVAAGAGVFLRPPGGGPLRSLEGGGWDHFAPQDSPDHGRFPA